LTTPLCVKTKWNVELWVAWHTSAVFCCSTGLPACRPAATSIVTCHARRYKLPALVRLRRRDYCRRLKHLLPALHFGPSHNARTVSVYLRMKRREIIKGYDYIGPPLWSSGQSSWLQIWRCRVRFPGTTRKKVVGLERGPLSLVSATEELLGRNGSGSGLEIRQYGRRDSSRWPRGTLYPQKVGTNFTDKL
jgi:hypothetical protein